jgi:hypothetical protein
MNVVAQDYWQRTLVNPNDTSLVGSFNNGVNGVGFSNLNVAQGPLQINSNPGNGQLYFNTALFNLPALGSPGNASRRFFDGPGMDSWDIALLKETYFTETKVLEFRMETFNTFNHAQLFGANAVDGNINDTTFGHVINADSSRLMQAALSSAFDPHGSEEPGWGHFRRVVAYALDRRPQEKVSDPFSAST